MAAADASPHTAGPWQVVFGGAIASIIGCHSICSAIAATYWAEGRPIGAHLRNFYATGTLQLKYLRPTPLGQPVVLRVRTAASTARRAVILCSWWSGGAERVQTEVMVVRVAYLL